MKKKNLAKSHQVPTIPMEAYLTGALQKQDGHG